MKTSNFANNQRYDLKGISISRWPATRQGFKGPEFPPLFPSAQLLKNYKNGMSWMEYKFHYQQQLDCLDPMKMYQRLEVIAASIGASEPILLCYESAKTLDENPCHRRLVAEWFEKSLDDVVVPEWSQEG